MKETEDIWPKNITVDKRIVKILSESTYENFPRALKELVTNSYDADSRNVNITVNLKEETIIIDDDGKGMDESDFTFYLRIAGKKREKESTYTSLGRPIIGQFGVGFLSIFPFFKSYNIETKKLGSSAIVYASIPLAKYFLGDNKMIDIESIAINGGIREDKRQINRSYTKITLNGFNGLTKSFFQSKGEGTKVRKNDPTYEPKGLELLKWTLSEDLPLKFKSDKFNEIFNYKEAVPFTVQVNGDRLHRNVFGDEILETHKGSGQNIGQIRFKYFVATPRKIIHPKKGRYFKIRNLNVGVGERDDFGMDRGEGSHQRWIYGEIHIIEGMNNLIKVSRDGFNYSPDFEELKDFFNSKLRQFSTLLSNETKFEKEVKQTGKEFRVSDVRLLNRNNLKDKLEAYKKEGYSIKHENTPKPGKPIKIDQEKKEITISGGAKFEKSIQVQGKKYKVGAEQWDYESEEFPACRVDGSRIVINQNYPLFKSVKYTDIFVKMHLMLALNLEQGNINKKTFKLLSDEILSYCKDYIK
jgi:hypothetical protein